EFPFRIKNLILQETSRAFQSRQWNERVKGIEPSYAAWEAAVLPLNYTRMRDKASASSKGLHYSAAHGFLRKTMRFLSATHEINSGNHYNSAYEYKHRNSRIEIRPYTQLRASAFTHYAGAENRPGPPDAAVGHSLPPCRPGSGQGVRAQRAHHPGNRFRHGRDHPEDR